MYVCMYVCIYRDTDRYAPERYAYILYIYIYIYIYVCVCFFLFMFFCVILHSILSPVVTTCYTLPYHTSR